MTIVWNVVALVIGTFLIVISILHAVSKRRARLQKEAIEYALVHGLLTTTIHQALESKKIDASLLKNRVLLAQFGEDDREWVVAQKALKQFLANCDDYLFYLKQMIRYDHRYLKSFPKGSREGMLHEHATWHAADQETRELCESLEDLKLLLHVSPID